MTCEVCPFCGKTYKRLKSHLPHCKAAAASKAPPSKLDVTANQTASSSQLDSVLSRATTKERKSSVITDLQRQTCKRDTASGPSNAPSSSSPRTSSSLTLLSPITKKKQKLVDQIKTSTLLLSPSPPLPPPTSKPKKKSLRALIEAAKSEQITKGSLKVSETEPTLSSRNTAQTKTKTNPGTDYAHLYTGTKPKDATKKMPKTKKVNQMLFTTKQSESRTKSPEKRHNFWDDGKQEIEDSSMNNLVLKLENGHQAKITLQDVKATLGRARPPRQSSRPSILSQIQTDDNLCSQFGVDTGVGPVPLLEDSQKYVATQSEELLSTSPQHAGQKSDKKIPSKTKQLALVPLRDVPESTPPATPFLPAHVSHQLWQAMPPPVNLNEGLKVSHHMTGLLTKSTPAGQFSSLLCPLVSQSLQVTVEKPEVRKQSTAENPTEGALTHRSLGQVRLRELPKWLACKAPSHPKDAVEMLQRGWQWYYRRYIDVRKGGVGGLGMLLAGYCVLSYIWSYHHIKLDRWRKYH